MQDHFTVIISHYVAPQQHAKFEQALTQVIAQAKAFVGYEGVQIIDPSTSGIHNEYLLIVRFDQEANYKKWEASPARNGWGQTLADMVQKQSVVSYHSGVNFWFNSSPSPQQTAPSKWKMAVLAWCAAFPLILLFNYILSWAYPSLPLLLKMVFLSMAMITGMTYVIMPRLTHWFAFWLQPPATA
jgi:antibiotic biosynthesis monooxygenase (ABM) superfamily enzyme